MICAVFNTKNDRPVCVTVKGHAEYAEHGSDIVCAAVSATLQMCANGITEILKQPANLIVGDNKIELSLADNADNLATQYLESFLLQLKNLEEEYPQNINIKIMEV